ncbi:MAG: methionine synthase [Chloroflexota bacterium]
MVGSYTVPDWYEPLQKAVERGEIGPEVFRDAKTIAARAAIHDQERAGIDVITDGEMFRRNDNRHGPPKGMINYFTEKIPGFAPETRPKAGFSPVDPAVFHPAPVVIDRLQCTPLGLMDELEFVRANSDCRIKITMTGPHFITKVVWNEHYPDEKSLAMDLARLINRELRQLDAAGCDYIQLDEALLWVMPAEDQEWAIPAINACFEGVTQAKKCLHLCQGNYNVDPTQRVGRRLFPGPWEKIFPAVLQTNVDQIVIIAIDVGLEKLEIFKQHGWRGEVAVGIVDVQTHRIETDEEVARNIERVFRYLPPEQVALVPTCGLNHLPRDIAFGKLCALAGGAALVRGEQLVPA